MKKVILYLYIVLLILIGNARDFPYLPVYSGAGTAEVYKNSIFYIGGGSDWSGNNLFPYIYKLNGNTWTFFASIPDSNVWDVESVLIGDEIFLLGGWPEGAHLIRKFHIPSKKWTYLHSSPNTQSWGITVEYFAGNIYLFNSAADVFEYNISNNQWIRKSSAPVRGTWDLSSTIIGQNIYILGLNNRTFYKYSVVKDKWQKLTDSPYRIGAGSLINHNQNIYIIGGNQNSGSSAHYRNILVYNVMNDLWGMDKFELSQKRHWMSAVNYDDKIIVLGGIDSIANAVNIVKAVIPKGVDNLLSDENTFPQAFYLEQNYPNPFNPLTTIKYHLPQKAYVKIDIFDVSGKYLLSLFDDFSNEGIKQVKWNAANFASGLYIYRLKVNNIVFVKKMLLLK